MSVDATNKNRLTSLIWVPLACGLMSCQALPQLGAKSTPVSTPSLGVPQDNTTSPTLVVPSPVVKPVTFALMVENPGADLRIKQGAFIRKGQIIAEPTAQRLRLENRKKELAIQLNGIEKAAVLNLNTKAEEQAIALAQKQVIAAQSALQDYERNSPWTDFARDNLPLAKEEVQLNRLKNSLKQAQTDLATAEAKLSEKQTAIGNFQENQVETRTRLQQELIQLEQQLAALKATPSQYSGTISKISLPQSATLGQPIKVTVTLLPGEAPAQTTTSRSGGNTLPNQPPANRTNSPVDVPAVSPSPSLPDPSVPNLPLNLPGQ